MSTLIKAPSRGGAGSPRRVAVVGATIASMMTAVRLAEAGVAVDLYSVVALERSSGVLAADGLAAAIHDGDSPAVHADDMVRVGAGLVAPAIARALAESAPTTLDLLARMGVPFNRTAEGRLAARGASGATHPRSATAGVTTGRQLVSALMRRLRRLAQDAARDGRGVEAPGEPLVRRFERWDFLGLVLDDSGRSIGLVAQDLVSMAIQAVPYDAVAIATGGAGAVFGRTTASRISDGCAAAIVHLQGAAMANMEMLGFDAATFGAGGTRHAIADFVLAEGGRFWLPKDASDARPPSEIGERERDYLVEGSEAEAAKRAAPHEIARALYVACVRDGRGVRESGGEPTRAVYLDMTRLRRGGGDLGPALEAAQRWTGVDATKKPLAVFPAVQTTLGGLWVDLESNAAGSITADSPRNHATTIPGLYAVGEVEHRYAGAGRISGDGHTAELFGATLTAAAIVSYRSAITKSAKDLPKSIFEKARAREVARYEALLERDGEESPYALQRELGAAMDAACTFLRDDGELDGLVGKLGDLSERASKAKSADTATRVNQGAPMLRHVEASLVFANVVAKSARHRDESRGAHDKPAFAAQDDAAWRRSTLAVHDADGVKFVRELTYESLGKTVRVDDSIDLSPTKASGEARG